MPALGPGASHATQGQTLTAFFSSLIATVCIFAVQLVLFLIVRKKLPDIYLLKEGEVSCLEEEFFLRYLKMILIMYGAGACIMSPILLPLHYLSGSKGEYFRLDMLTFSNISDGNTGRLTAHLVLVTAYILFVCGIVHVELGRYVAMKRTVMTKMDHKLTAGARTVLFRGIPKEFTSEAKIEKMLNVLPGGVKKVWLNRDYQSLVDKIKERDVLLKRLEIILTQIVMECQRKGTQGESLVERISTTARTATAASARFFPRILPGQHYRHYLDKKDLPRVRMPRFQPFGIPIIVPFLSTSIDAVTWHKAELNRLNLEIQKLQESYQAFPHLRSCFVQFEKQIAAHLACQALIFENPELVGLSALEIDPRDVLWDNLGLGWKDMFWRKVVATAFNLVIIVGWTFPVAFLAVLSQVDYLPSLIPGFAWVDHVPPRMRLIVSSIMPAVVISGMMGMAPFVFRCLARLKGFATKSGEQGDVQSYMFPFMFIQVFLVVAISRGMMAVVFQVVHLPFTILTLLAYNVPKGANFFYSYIFLQGLTMSGDALLQTQRLFRRLVWKKLMESTPRDRYERLTDSSELDWGSLYPGITILAVIGMVYSAVAPMINIFGSVAFSIMYGSYRYRILYCNSA